MQQTPVKALFSLEKVFKNETNVTYALENNKVLDKDGFHKTS